MCPESQDVEPTADLKPRGVATTDAAGAMHQGPAVTGGPVCPEHSANTSDLNGNIEVQVLTI